MNSSSDVTIPFTKAGYQTILDKLDVLNNNRPNILKRLQTAREMGDLSENGAYKAARFELSDTDRQVRRLTYLKIMGRVAVPRQHVQVEFGNQVTLTKSNGEITYTLVNQYEADPQKFKISVDSPLGQALLGKKAGDQVDFTTPAGPSYFKIKAIG